MSGENRGLIFGVVGAVVGFLLPPGNVYGAVALGAAGYGAGAELDAADKQVAAAKQNQDLSDKQANEIMNRASENTKAINADFQTFHGQQVSAGARGGVDVGSGSSLIALENAKANSDRQAYLESRDASLTASRVRAQAQFGVDAAESARQAANIHAGMSVLGSAFSAYGNRVGTPSVASTSSAPSSNGYGSAGESYYNNNVA